MHNGFKIIIFLLLAFSCAKHEQKNNFTDGKVVRERAPLSVQQDLLKAVVSNDYLAVNRIADTPNIDLDMILADDKNALMESVALDYLLITELLITKGADVKFENKAAQTAYDFVVEKNEDMISVLDGNPLSEEFINKSFIESVKTAKAVEDKNSVIVKLNTLAVRGADINTIDEKKLSSLIYTVYDKQHELMEFLCTFDKLDVEFVGGKGRRKFSAKKLAKRKRDKKALEILENCPST